MTAGPADEGEELAAPLDLMLTDAALGLPRRLAPNSSWFALGRRLATRPQAVARRGTDLTRQLAQIAVGQSTITPAKRDRRFADPAWQQNPFLRRTVQAYVLDLAPGRSLVEYLLREGQRAHRRGNRGRVAEGGGLAPGQLVAVLRRVARLPQR